MKVLRYLRSTAVVLASMSWLVPWNCIQAAPQIAAPQTATPLVKASVIDVALDAGGRMRGQVVDAQGKPLVKETVVAQSVASRQVAQTTTDDHGRFVLEGLGGGVHRVATTNSTIVCRCWAGGAAPPAASNQLLMVSDESIHRGQRPIGEILTNPILLGLLLTAAIVIPIAVHNSQDDGS
jgi:hypothetical protein